MAKLQFIYNQLSFLLSQFTNINVKNLSELPKQIENMIIGENKIPLLANRSIQVVTENDLSGVITIGTRAFQSCNNLTSITIPESVKTIGDYVFTSCTSLTSVTIPDSVTTIGDYAFYYCAKLKSIIIPDSVTSIGYNAFNNCVNLTSVTIPDSVTTIGSFAFEYCTSLTSVTIGDSVTSIGAYAFDDCSKLSDIYLKPTAPPSLVNKYSIPDTTTIHVPVGSGDAYRNATNWSYHATRIIEDPEL